MRTGGTRRGDGVFPFSCRRFTQRRLRKRNPNVVESDAEAAKTPTETSPKLRIFFVFCRRRFERAPQRRSASVDGILNANII